MCLLIAFDYVTVIDLVIDYVSIEVVFSLELIVLMF